MKQYLEEAVKERKTDYLIKDVRLKAKKKNPSISVQIPDKHILLSKKKVEFQSCLFLLYILLHFQ